MGDLALAMDAASTTTIARPYRPTSGASVFPPPPEELVRNLIPTGYTTATAPHQAARSRLLVTINVDGGQQIVMPLVKMVDDNQVTAFSSVLDSLNTIRDHLALSVTQMAELFNVTRKAVYDWYEGAEPRPAATARISALAEILASSPARNELQRLKTVWKVPVSGRSFLNVVNDEKLNPSELRQALVNKLDELSPRLAATNRVLPRTSVDLGQAHLADVDRDTDFG